MNHAQIAETLQARLLTLHAEITALETATTQALPAKFADQVGDLADLATNESLEVAHIHEAGQIVAALARLESGQYGVCSRCGGDIAPARLAALPTATNCIACAA